jgi:hypothetical protein
MSAPTLLLLLLLLLLACTDYIGGLQMGELPYCPSVTDTTGQTNCSSKSEATNAPQGVTHIRQYTLNTRWDSCSSTSEEP